MYKVSVGDWNVEAGFREVKEQKLLAYQRSHYHQVHTQTRHEKSTMCYSWIRIIFDRATSIRLLLDEAN